MLYLSVDQRQFAVCVHARGSGRTGSVKVPVRYGRVKTIFDVDLFALTPAVLLAIMESEMP